MTNQFTSGKNTRLRTLTYLQAIAVEGIAEAWIVGIAKAVDCSRESVADAIESLIVREKIQKVRSPSPRVSGLYRVLDMTPMVAEVYDPGANADWPNDDVRLLRELWNAGYSRGIIADRLKRRKNQIVGKVRLLIEAGLLFKRPADLPIITKPSGYNTGDPAVRKPRAMREFTLPALASQPMASVPVVAPPEPPRVTYVLPSSPPRGGCVFPLWGDTERPTHLYCGAVSAGPYCVVHRKVCFSKVGSWAA